MELSINEKLNNLSKILEKEKISDSTYTLELGGTCPCGMGIDYIDNVWYTYSCELGGKYDFNKQQSFDLAIKDMINMISPSKKISKRIYKKYKRTTK